MGILTAVLGLTFFLGWLLYDKKLKTLHQSSSSQQIEKPKIIPRIKTPEAAPPDQETRSVPPGPYEILKKLERLRHELLLKQKDIADLKKHFTHGIDEVIIEVLNEKRKNRVASYQQAIKDKRIELGLRTIQRRRAYLQRLDEPFHKLYLGSEELLYLKRQAEIDIQMACITGGIEADELVKRINAVIQKHIIMVDRLALGTKDERLQSLETVWKKIGSGEKKTGDKRVSFSQQDRKDSEIWRDICNFERKHELTGLSSEATKCLSKWKGKDLFLNGLTGLSPQVAEHLSHWQGSWLCLNGLAYLSPKAAKNLFQWQGSRLSLNGVTELSSQVAKYLSYWKGNQLELIGLSRLSPQVAEYLSHWAKSGGKLYIPNKFKKKGYH